MADESVRLPFDHEKFGRRYILLWALDERTMPRFVECYECDQPDAVWIPDLGFSTHVRSVWKTRPEAASVAETKLRAEIAERQKLLAQVLAMRSL